MPFVKRDEGGKITAVFQNPAEQGLEKVEFHDPGLTDFLIQSQIETLATREWVESDLAMVRVIEDLVDTLIEKGVIMFTDLPDAAQDKLRKRRGLRKEFVYVETLFADEDQVEGGNDDESGGQFL